MINGTLIFENTSTQVSNISTGCSNKELLIMYQEKSISLLQVILSRQRATTALERHGADINIYKISAQERSGTALEMSHLAVVRGRQLNRTKAVEGQRYRVPHAYGSIEKIRRAQNWVARFLQQLRYLRLENWI